jgi:general secretion pathway protein G
MKADGLEEEQRALTRVEVLLAILVLGVLAAMVCPNVFARKPYAALTRVQIGFSVLGTALDAFQQDCGHYPNGTNALLQLMQQPAGTTNWRGPYLEPSWFQDPWGRDYIYRYPGSHTNSGYPYDLISLGPLGENSGISNWSKQP